MMLENLYLRKAVAKSGYVIIVKTLQKNNGVSKLEYISPNADTIGINVELINKGMRLTEDYIFPEDRNKVIKTVKEAYENKIQNYVHDFRMVGDNGVLYNVTDEIFIEDIDSETYRIEMYLKLTDSKTKGQPKKDVKHSSEVKGEKYIHSEKFSGFPALLKTFSALSKLYCAFVDLDGKVVFPPVGPATNLGDFYDLFEKPVYKEYYKYIKERVISEDVPVVIDREEGGVGKICAMPIFKGGDMMGIWIVGSYTQEETDYLEEITEYQKAVGELISDYIEKTEKLSVEMAKASGVGTKLREELAKQSIINGALSKINSKLIDSVDQVVSEVLRDVGINMDAEKIILYTSKTGKLQDFELSNFWDASGKAPSDEVAKDIPNSMLVFQREFEENEGQYYLDSSNASEEKKLTLMRYGFKAAIAQGIFMKGELRGMIVLATSRTERVWTKGDLTFVKNIGAVIQNMLENAYGDDNIRNVNNHLIETYNNFNVGIFVRDTYTGEVLFSNKLMNSMMGCDFVGGDSREIITDLHDRFDNITGMRKPFISKERVVNWRSYIQRLDAIMDITEIKIEWLSGQPASLIILRHAKDA